MNEQGTSITCDRAIRAHKLCMGLNDIMMLINSSHDLDEILHKVVEASNKALGCESARIAMREGGNWVIRYVSNMPDDFIGRSFTDEELPHAALAMTTRRPVAIDDAIHDDRTNNQMMESLGIRSVMVLPLMEKNEVIGTLLYGHSRAVSFTNAEKDYAERMATGVAIALQDARLHQDLEESKRLGDALNEIDTVLFSTKDHDVIMNRMLQLSTEAIGAESAVIFSKEGDRWKVWYEYMLPVSLVGQTFSNTEVMHSAITAVTRRSLVVQDVLNSPDIDQNFVKMMGVRSLLDFPLIVKGEVVGDLTFHYHSSDVPFNERQVEFVRKLQISISLALENGRLLDTLKQSESMLKEAERLGKSGYFSYDVRTRKIIWSEGVFHILGRDPVLGEPTVEEFFELYSVDPGPEAMRELVENEASTEFDAKIIREDLVHVFHFVVRSMKDANEDIVAFFGTIQDITERKCDEDALRESEERFHLLADTAPVLIWMSGTDSLCTFLNKPWLAFTGRSFEQEQGNGWQEGVHPDDIQRTLGTYLSDFNARRDFHLEYRLRRADGVYRWVADTGVPRFTLNGDFTGYIGSCFDITERKYAKEEIQKLNLILAEKADELEAANKELESFNYTVAHDLRGPLNSIGLYFQTIEKLCGARLDETCTEYLTGGYRNVQRMSQLIDVLLEFSKLSHVDPQPENVDISAVALEIVDELKRTSPERRHVFRIADGIVVSGDPKLLRVALNNLLRNAWKYTGKREEAVIEFGAAEIGGKRAYFVRDNGEGFEMADSDKLFTPFQRLPGAEEFKGSGIGLATVERIIRRHGGKVWAEGEPGRGACFYFTLSAD